MNTEIITPEEGANLDGVFFGTASGHIDSEKKYELPDGRQIECVYAYGVVTVLETDNQWRHSYQYQNADWMIKK